MRAQRNDTHIHITTATEAVRASYLRQLALPLSNADMTLAAYCDWEPEPARRAEAEALHERLQTDEMTELRADWERRVAEAATPAQKWQLWCEVWPRPQPCPSPGIVSGPGTKSFNAF